MNKIKYITFFFGVGCLIISIILLLLHYIEKGICLIISMFGFVSMLMGILLPITLCRYP